MADLFLGNPNIQADKISSPTGSSSLDMGGRTLTNVTTTGYVLNLYAGTFSPADLSLYYFGSLFNTAPMTVAGAVRVYIPKAGTIKRFYIISNQVAGSSEASVLTLRLNNTSDTDLTTNFVQSSISPTPITGTVSIAVSQDDYIEMKYITPNWATNPTNVRISVQLYIE